MPYRPDIDGLRALAVSVVVLFHVGFAQIPGGFVGVDVFFVVSGFLITGLITTGLREGDFSFWEFYARRTRRIYPALFVLIAAVLVAGYFALTPAEYEALGESALYSSAFLANVYFWLHTGYFDRAAETMPLLHVWSIGVEEQFYLLWPFLLVGLWGFARLGRNAVLAALIGATILLALLCIVWTAYDQKGAFFLPFTRLWEFTLGALILALPSVTRRPFPDLLAGLGLAAILYAAFAFNEGLDYPGAYAIVPCLGTAAVLAAGGNGIFARFLSLPPSVFLGKISYSVYLWHWPLIVFYGNYAERGDSKALLILASVAIAAFSWRFIETPIRRRRDNPRLTVASGAALALTTGAVAALVMVTNGFPGRLPEGLRGLASDKEMTALKCTEQVKLDGLGKKPNCVIGAAWEGAAKRAVLWGDSHARHLAPLLDGPARAQGLSIVFWKGCPPFIDDDKVRRAKRKKANFTENCADTRRTLLEWLDKTPSVDLVIIANRWATFPDNLLGGGMFERGEGDKALAKIREGIAKTVAEIDPARHAILFVGDVPYPDFNVPDCALASFAPHLRKPCSHDLSPFLEIDRPLQHVLAEAAAGEGDRVYYVDPVKGMCGAEGCPLKLEGEVLYSDSHHIRHNLKPSTFEKLNAMIGTDAALREATSGARPAGAEFTHPDAASPR